MAITAITHRPYLVGAAGFQWEAPGLLSQFDTHLVRASRPYVFSWAVAHPAPHGEHWAQVSLHGTRKEAEKAAGGRGHIFQGSFSSPREGLVVARGRVFPAW